MKNKYFYIKKLFIIIHELKEKKEKKSKKMANLTPENEKGKEK